MSVSVHGAKAVCDNMGVEFSENNRYKVADVWIDHYDKIKGNASDIQKVEFREPGRTKVDETEPTPQVLYTGPQVLRPLS